MALWNSALSLTLGVAPSLLLPPTLALQVAHSGADALDGWRAEILTADLTKFLDGESGLFLGEAGPEIR